jgi:hypothetical protein
MSETEDKANQISTRTTPTWEVELLISGATVFSLLQLPSPLHRWLSIAGQAQGESVYQAIKIFGIYIQFSLWILIITFVMHLFMRGYWIALVGMNSVFPKGIQWEKVRGFGPIYKESLEKNHAPIPVLIEAADNRATIIFGLGFGTVMTMIILSLLMAVLIGILLVMQLFGLDTKSDDIVIVLMAIIIGPYFVIYILDKYLGHKLINHAVGNWIDKIIVFYNGLGFGRSGSVLINLYRTNQSQRKGYLIMGLLAAMGAASSFIWKFNAPDARGAYMALPSSSQSTGLELPVEYYATLRQETDIQSIQPYIESPVSAGPYLRLFIPYVPRHYNATVLASCPQALSRKSANAGEGLQCLSKLLRISIDGKVILVDLLSSRDPSTGQRGVIAMIPIQALDAGRHEVSLVSLRHDEEDSEKPVKETLVRIPFWK